MCDFPAYLGLFVAAFGAATLLPMQSETLLDGLLLATEQPPALLLLVAPTGNILGSAANWLLGRDIEHFRHSWFPVSEDKLQRAWQAFHRYGSWSLL